LQSHANISNVGVTIKTD